MWAVQESNGDVMEPKKGQTRGMVVVEVGKEDDGEHKAFEMCVDVRGTKG